MSFKLLHDFCIGCKKTRVAEKEGPIDEDTGEPEYRAGDFIVACKGIPSDSKFIPKQSQIESQLSPEELTLAETIYDPIKWAEHYLNWKPRISKKGDEYQALTLRCSSRRKALRWGRRLGKTDVLAIRALHFLYTHSPKAQRWDENRQEWVNDFGTALVLTPFLSQVKNLFNRMKELIESNPQLEDEVVRSISTPYHLIELKSGTKIVGFSAGAKGAESVRGQKSDLIILDEMDYLDEASIENIVALIMEHSDVELIAASTPSGRREYFYKFCRERMDFKEFHYTSMHNPSWGPAMERELREFYNTEAGWQHEILAEFGEATTSVFQYAYVKNARKDFRYADCVPEPDWIYSMGVDWNDVHNGTKICITGYNTVKNYFKVVAKATVQKVGWTQTAAIEKMIEMNRVWQPDYFYVDAGYGAMQVEVIKKFGLDAKYSKSEWAEVDAKLANVVGINFSSKVEIKDPLTGEPIKKPMKPYLVNNAVRRFEQGIVHFSVYDETMFKQLIGYQISKVTASGQEVYEKGPDGDHDLDGLMLSLLAFQMETSEFIKTTYNNQISFSGSFGDGKGEEAPQSLGEALDRIDNTPMKGGVPEPRSNYTKSAVSSFNNSRIYSPDAFNNDDRTHRSKRNRSSNFLRRGGQRSSRKSF
jgi:replicative DNA helicase